MLQTQTPGRTAPPPVMVPLKRQPAYPVVMTITGGYQVDLGPGRAPRFHLVLKDRSCNCGQRNCLGTAAIESYLKAGGRRAPEGQLLKDAIGPACPICGGPTRTLANRWECLQDSTHYFQYRVARLRAARERWLAGLSPETAAWQKEIDAAFASTAARAAFLQQHPLSYAAEA